MCLAPIYQEEWGIAGRRVDTRVVGHTEWSKLSLPVNGVLCGSRGQHGQEGAIESLN